MAADKFTVRHIKLQIEPEEYNPNKVQDTRATLMVSQKVFAQFLGVSVKTVRAWEQGINTPSQMACRFMDEIRVDPEHWRSRLVASAVAGNKS